MSQTTVDGIHLSIIKRRELEISLLEKKRDNIIEEIENKKDFLKAYKKIVPKVVLQ